MELTEIKGIGEARKKSFEENGIFSCEDLINFFPFKYYDFSKTEPFADDGRVRLIKATVIENPKIVKMRGNLSFVICKMNDEIGHAFSAVWFNQSFIKSQLYLGLTVYLYGKNSPKKRNTFNVILLKQQEKIKMFGLLPVYHSISGIGQATISDLINKILQTLKIPNILPDEYLLKYNLLSLADAYKTLHNPKCFDDVIKAKKVIDIHKLLSLIASNNENKILNKTKRVNYYENITNLYHEFNKILPFSLTVDQQKAINDLIEDFDSDFSMNRLLQGDVGSGKTAVAMFGLFAAARSGYQCTIIAPTEILAKQHYQTACEFFSGYNFGIALLTSSTSAPEKKIIIQKLAAGEIKILIGTISVLSEEVCFNNLSFAVIDEQHRFGVSQRARIKRKSNGVDVLVMSATPIPRSLSLVLYGNLDISAINSRPKQANITTNIVIQSKQNDMWNYIGNKIINGSKVYVVCSKIDEENEDDDKISFSAKNMYDSLLLRFDKNDLGLIHGKLKKQAQDNVIENFRLGKIKILVSTTIVEVGVDIPDSDIMVIASPERFGLATLHQLRGRIGRNGKEAHCFCLANHLNEKSFERIKFFKEHSNGFEIAEFDLKTRGAGSMFGTNQHGKNLDFDVAFSAETYLIAKNIFDDIKHDAQIVKNLLDGYDIESQKFGQIILN